jgi:hypothetical protein
MTNITVISRLKLIVMTQYQCQLVLSLSVLAKKIGSDVLGALSLPVSSKPTVMEPAVNVRSIVVLVAIPG